MNISTPNCVYLNSTEFSQCGKADLNSILYSCFINEAQDKKHLPRTQRYFFKNSYPKILVYKQ